MTEHIAPLAPPHDTPAAPESQRPPLALAAPGPALWAPAGRGPYVGLSLGMEMLADLPRFLGRRIVYRPWRMPRDAAGVIGWGLKGEISRRARDLALRYSLPYVALEDGFLRSVGLGHQDDPLSICVDDIGIYYDAREPSRLEALISSKAQPRDGERARRLRQRWCEARVSKYNHVRERAIDLPERHVLVVDQTYGDASIRYGLASEASFHRMLEAALDEHPSLPVLLKVHPDVIAGRKRAHFAALSPGESERVRLFSEDVHPPALFAGAAAVYTVTSQMGFEALLWDRPVRCFGMPFYAGWGLTGDELPTLARRRRPTSVPLELLVEAALIDYPRYLDPETGERCDAERVLQWIELQRRQRQRFADHVMLAGVPASWRRVARAVFAGSRIEFADRVTTTPPETATAAAAAPPAVLQLRPGPVAPFTGLRTRKPPIGWIAEPPDVDVGAGLDELLRRAPCTAEERLCASRWMKRWRLWREAADPGGANLRRSKDAPSRSIRLIVADADEAPALVRVVRERYSDDRLVLMLSESHPRARSSRAPGDSIAPMIDGRAPCSRLPAWVRHADAVHAGNSCLGFEALLLGATVICHDMPFYAGRGLTSDTLPLHTSRTSLDLESLVVAAVLRRPVYVSRATGRYTDPERALDEATGAVHPWRRTKPWKPRLLRALKRARDRLRKRPGA